MSSLSFENIFSSDTADRAEGVSIPVSASRASEKTAPRSEPIRAVPFPLKGAVDQASPWAHCAMRRVLDATVAAIALIVFFPIMLIAALLVWWGSPGSVFFRQRRMGRNGREFILYKFRSMCPKKGSNSSITVSGDVRITPVGALLRRYKLDELPQFWNVLRGDMSLVGPRPKLPHHEALLMVCRPGITGVATLAFRNEEEFLSEIPEDELETFYEVFVKPAKAQLDLEYMRTATFASDMKVLWRTASACLFSSDDGLSESAETITHYDVATRMQSTKHLSPAAIHPRNRAAALSASLNQEL
jgi:lipopolysaccharide/colanic/teichoic acid biosynthesis glycosyltransferase